LKPEETQRASQFQTSSATAKGGHTLGPFISIYFLRISAKIEIHVFFESTYLLTKINPYLQPGQEEIL
jgi:hypothetical protein